MRKLGHGMCRTDCIDLLIKSPQLLPPGAILYDAPCARINENLFPKDDARMTTPD